ncbi:MAG: penicillin acylase family protein [Bryobacterales bacterium]|nr:penicillin acylase family protein [Bryobacterales bacterium]
MLQRILKYTNILILVLLVAGAAAFGWFGWRTLPTTTGNVEAPLTAEGVIRRDNLGVPHIEAASVEDALFLQGYATAQDRLWQLDALRRSTAGELAEVAGRAALQPDLAARRLGFRRTALTQESRMTPRDRAHFAAYARGVNHFLDTHRDRLPPEFTLLDYEPRPWTISDSILVALRMASDLSTSWQADLDAERMRAELAKTFPDLSDPQRDELLERLFPLRRGDEGLAGSNAWALAGSLTSSGKPLLANDMHLAMGFPSTWTMVHLKAGDLDVAGFALPGLPGVIVGHNQRIAWGITNLGPDVQDLYEERIDLASGRYQYGNEVRQAAQITEVIRVKGEADVRLNVLVTHHGPLIQTVADEPAKRNLAIRWTALSPDFIQYPFLDLNLARDWEEFRLALSRFPGPPQNLVYADVDGNIGYQATGRIPVRTSSGNLPLAGADPSTEWPGFIPFDDLPRIYNPPSGLIATANQNPFPPGYPLRVNGNFASPHRAGHIIARLKARKDWDAPGMLDIQKDVYSPHYVFVARQLLAAAAKNPPKDDFAQQALTILRDWNGQAELDQTGATIARLASEGLLADMLKRLAPDWEEPRVRMSDTVLQWMLSERPGLLSENYDAWLMETFAKVLQDARGRLGGDLSRWQYKAVSRITVDHPIFARVPLVGRYFSLGGKVVSGSPSSPKQVTARLGPSQRFVADLGDWEKSLANVTIGISGHPFSSHYRDQWKAFYNGTSFPMPFRSPTIAAEQRFVPPGR